MNDNYPLVSVIVNCYNGEEFLQRAINSILVQTYKNLEIIFWDNASTDRSAEIYKHITANDFRFKYYKSEENASLGQARAWAVNECSGEYITFLDVDDEWLPEKTKIQVLEMQKDDYVLGYAPCYGIYGENLKNVKESTLRWSSGKIFPNLLTQFEIPLITAIIKREALIEKNLNFDPIIQASEEYCLFMQLIYDEKVCVVDKPLARYYIRKDSLTQKCIDRWAFERRYTLDRICQSHADYKKYDKEFKEAYARGDYYEARYLVSNGQKKRARSLLLRNKTVSYKYLLLYWILFFPKVFWDIIHEKKNKR